MMFTPGQKEKCLFFLISVPLTWKSADDMFCWAPEGVYAGGGPWGANPPPPTVSLEAGARVALPPS